jgi:hypothetical protein
MCNSFPSDPVTADIQRDLEQNASGIASGFEAAQDSDFSNCARSVLAIHPQVQVWKRLNPDQNAALRNHWISYHAPIQILHGSWFLNHSISIPVTTNPLQHYPEHSYNKDHHYRRLKGEQRISIKSAYRKAPPKRSPASHNSLRRNRDFRTTAVNFR